MREGRGREDPASLGRPAPDQLVPAAMEEGGSLARVHRWCCGLIRIPGVGRAIEAQTSQKSQRVGHTFPRSEPGTA